MKAWEICKKENVGKVYKDSEGNKWVVTENKNMYDKNDLLYDLEDLNGYPHGFAISEIAELDFEEVIDWSKVPVDTKILVSNFGTKQYKAYFAKYEDGKIYAWDSGRTSFTAGFENNMACWDYVKLYKEGEE